MLQRFNMKYKLTEEDYLYLYPYLSPTRIKILFGEGSKSPRTIQRIYKNAGLLPSDIALEAIIDKSSAIRELDCDEQTWRQNVLELIAVERNKRIDTINNKAKKYEKL